MTGFREHVDVRHFPPLLDIAGVVRIRAATSRDGYVQEFRYPTAKRPAYCSVHTLDEAEYWIRERAYRYGWEELLPNDWVERLHQGNARARYHYVCSEYRLHFAGIWVVGGEQTAFIDVWTLALVTYPMREHPIPAVFRAMDSDLRRLVARIWVHHRARRAMLELER